MCITFKSEIFQDSARAEENLYHRELLENINFRQLTVTATIIIILNHMQKYESRYSSSLHNN